MSDQTKGEPLVDAPIDVCLDPSHTSQTRTFNKGHDCSKPEALGGYVFVSAAPAGAVVVNEPQA